MKTFKDDFFLMLKFVGIVLIVSAIFLNMAEILNNQSDIQKLQDQVFELSLKKVEKVEKAEKGETKNGRQN